MFQTFSSMVSLPGLLLWSLVWGVTPVVGEVGARLGNRTIERTVNLRTHSIYAPYIDQDLQNRWWDFGADSYINTNKHIRLTRNRPSQMGWLWSRLALTPHNFVIETEFKISGDSTHLFGDGLALWLTTERTQPGPVFGSKDRFNGLAIIVDTYANARHSYSFPRISGFLNDGTTSYDFGSDGEGQTIGACSANVRRTNVATKLKVTYIRGELLDVKVQYKAWDDWSDCFSVQNITLPANPFLGFSAMTGDISDAHDIISVSASSAILSAPDSQRDKMQKPGVWHGDSSESTWFGFFFKLVLFFGLVGGGVYGWRHYQGRQRYGGFGGGNFGGGGGGMFDNGGRGRFGGPFADGKRF